MFVVSLVTAHLLLLLSLFQLMMSSSDDAGGGARKYCQRNGHHRSISDFGYNSRNISDGGGNFVWSQEDGGVELLGMSLCHR